MKILILGGGISGLSAAWRLRALLPNAEIVLLEKSSRLGGWIQTEKKGSFLFEKGPRTFSSSRSPAFLNLIAEAGLEDEVLFSCPKANTRYLLQNGRLKSAFSLLLPHIWRLFLEPFIPVAKEEETIHDFACRRFGTKIAELLFDPLTLGVFAGDSRTLSMQACFPKLSGSLVLAMFKRQGKKTFPGSLFTLKRGMQRLIDTLGSKLQGNVLLDREVLSLRRADGKWFVETTKESFTADVVFSALPAHVLKEFLPSMPKIDSASLNVVNLGFADLSFPKSGYGYLVPSKEKEDLLGMIFDSEIFGGPGCKLTAMVRPAAKDPKEVVIKALASHLGVKARPDHIEIHSAAQSIPQLGLGQKKSLLEWEATLSDFYLLGNYMEGPGVEQCVCRSEKIVSQFLINL